jgi:anthranilate phosphoribosyltransferase
VNTWRGVLGALMRGESLDSASTAWAMDEIMAGEATPAQLAAFVVLLRAKGETTDELAGLVETMRARATPVPVDAPAVDIVGTASSQCGSADVLEELGVVIDLDAAGVAATVAEVGVGFCFAPVFHPGMRHAGPPRREIGVPTVFNVLGPLTNPARPPASAVGSADRRMAPLMAEVFARRGDTALVFRGDDGLDELTTTTTSSVWVAADGDVHETVVDPRRFDLDVATPDDLRGGDRAHNAAVVHEVLAGRSGGARDAVLLNAGAAIAVYDGIDAWSTVDSLIAKGIDEARRAIDSGAAADLLARWAAASQRIRG